MNNQQKFEQDFFPFPEKDFRETFQWRIFRIMAEFVEGFQFVADFDKSVSFFGSSKLEKGDLYYEKAQKLARLLVREDFAVVTGGGPGIMQAANRGAYENDGRSIGVNIELPDQGEQANGYVTDSIGFHYFFTRKVMLSFSSEGYVFFPGGFGTLDEFFEMLTLVQTKKLPQPVTMVAVGKDFWYPLFDWFEETLVEDYDTVEKESLELVKVVEKPEEALEIIKNNNSN